MKAGKNVVIIDFGSRFIGDIIARINELEADYVLLPYDTPLDKIIEASPFCIILSGSPHSVYSENSPKADAAIFNLGIPILGICYGLQFIIHAFGGDVKAGEEEHGLHTITVKKSPLFAGLSKNLLCHMYHEDYVLSLPKGFKTVAKTLLCPNAAVQNEKRKIYGVQFHPEVSKQGEHGFEILKNFLYYSTL